MHMHNEPQVLLFPSEPPLDIFYGKTYIGIYLWHPETYPNNGSEGKSKTYGLSYVQTFFVTLYG